MKRVLLALLVLLSLTPRASAQDAATMFPCPAPYTGNLCLGAGDREVFLMSSGTPWVRVTRAGAISFLTGSTFTNASPGLFPNGTAAAPSIAFTTSTGSGLFLSGGAPNMSVAGTNTYVFGAATFQTNTAIVTNGNVTVPNDQAFSWTSRGLIKANADGVFQIVNGATTRKLDLQITTAPTCTSNCGTSPSIVGVDTSFDVTMGSTGVPASGWVITFGATWSTAPQCYVSSALATMVVGKMAIASVTTTGTLTVTTNGTAPATSDKYHVMCTAGT